MITGDNQRMYVGRRGDNTLDDRNYMSILLPQANGAAGPQTGVYATLMMPKTPVEPDRIATNKGWVMAPLKEAEYGWSAVFDTYVLGWTMTENQLSGMLSFARPGGTHPLTTMTGHDRDHDAVSFTFRFDGFAPVYERALGAYRARRDAFGAAPCADSQGG